MWEFRNRNVFGATAFSTYGGVLDRPRPVGQAGCRAAHQGPGGARDLGWILLAFAIFNTYMLIISTQLNLAVFGVFLTLELTEIFLFIGNFATKTGTGGLITVGGVLGIITALVAWYTSAAGVMNGIKGKLVFPVGSPLFNLGAPPATQENRASPGTGGSRARACQWSQSAPACSAAQVPIA